MAPQHDVDVEKTREAGRDETAAPPEQVGAFEHRQHVEEGEDGVRSAACRDDARHQRHVEADLHPREPAEIGPVHTADQEEARHERGRRYGQREGQELEREGTGVAQHGARDHDHRGRDEPRPAQAAQGLP